MQGHLVCTSALFACVTHCLCSSCQSGHIQLPMYCGRPTNTASVLDCLLKMFSPFYLLWSIFNICTNPSRCRDFMNPCSTGYRHIEAVQRPHACCTFTAAVGVWLGPFLPCYRKMKLTQTSGWCHLQAFLSNNIAFPVHSCHKLLTTAWVSHKPLGEVNVGGFVISYPALHTLHVYVDSQYARRLVKAPLQAQH